MQDSSNNSVEQKQSQPQTRAERAVKAKTSGHKPPDCGQVPVGMPTKPEQPKEEAPVAADKKGCEGDKKSETEAGTKTQILTLVTKVETPPKMPMTQAYAPHIAVASTLLSVILGLIIFKMRVKRKRLCKRCPHCGAALERWADECDSCRKNIFVYPSA